MDEGQPVLRADRQLLDQELEVVVARQRDDGAVRIGGAHAERGRQRPAERTGLAAIDPVARLVDVQELRAGDLAEPDRGDVGGVARQRLVHLLIDALRLERHLVEMRLALHRLLALPAFLRPARPVAQLARRLPFGGDVEQHLQRRARIGDDAEIGREDAADLRRLDVDVDELAAGRVFVDRAGVAVGPAVADAEHEVGGEHRRVAVAVRGLQPAHAGHQRMVVGDRAPAHQRRDDRNARDLGELDQQVRRVGVDDAAAGDDQRPLGLVQHGQRLLGLLARHGRLERRKRLVGVDVELDLGELDVDRQVDQHRAGTARAHQVERLLQRHRHLVGLHDGDRPFGDRRGDRRDIDRLEILLGEPRPRRLAGDAQDRDGIGRGRIEPGDHVGAGRAGRADAQPDIACLGAGVALGHVRGRLDMAGKDVADRAARLQRRIERVDRRARHAEGAAKYPSRSRTRTAASIARILAMSVSTSHLIGRTMPSRSAFFNFFRNIFHLRRKAP